MQVVNVTEAKSRFSELLSRATAGERFLIRRRERSLAVLINAAELDQLERQAGASIRLALALGQDADLLAQVSAEQVHPAMSAFGLWKDAPEFDQLADEIYDNRSQQVVRSGADL